MNNFQYFINLETEDGKKGQGDKLEVSQILNNMDIKISDPETGETLAEGEAARLNFRPNYLLYVPVFCMTYIDSEMLQVIKSTDDYVETMIKFPSELEEKIKNQFGNDVLIISPQPFMERISEMTTRKGLGLEGNKVIYTDYSKNDKSRIEEFNVGHRNLFFRKDKSFSYQSEYRIVLPNEQTESHIIKNIGDISSFSYLRPVSDLFTGKFTMKFRFEK